MSVTIVWFRNDLRLADNPALDWAIKQGNPVVPIYIWAPEEEASWPLGGASRWWLHHSLMALQISLQKLGTRLIIRHGHSLEVLQKLIRETGATAVSWNRRYEPAIISRDATIKETLSTSGVRAESFNGSLICEPWKGGKRDGTPYQVFTPFWRNQVTNGFGSIPFTKPEKLLAPDTAAISLSPENLNLLPAIPWDSGFKVWEPGEVGAQKRLSYLLSNIINSYSIMRNIPSTHGTSMLSPHLHFGEISSNQVLHAIRTSFPGTELAVDAETYVKELVWREFAYHLLFYFPHTPSKALNPRFETFPWIRNQAYLSAWQNGLTGYPIVDAGMRELWATGWMHNRVRMIVSSFLVKHLRIAWQAGAAWFWDTLVDADLASNTMGWQWSGGCGADAAPYFRIFNPMLQGKKFDPKGEYVKKWCPELAHLQPKYIHAPWEASKRDLSKVGIILGKTYPYPIVDHAEARQQALEAYQQIRT